MCIYTHTYTYVSVCLNISEMYENNDVSNGKEKLGFFFQLQGTHTTHEVVQYYLKVN